MVTLSNWIFTWKAGFILLVVSDKGETDLTESYPKAFTVMVVTYLEASLQAEQFACTTKETSALWWQ